MAVFLPDEQKYIEKLIEIVEENFHNNNFGSADLAKEMGISHSTLYRRLRAIAKQSVTQFIRETRLKRAMELLQLQAGSVAEIAYGVGFGSTTYFSKCFRDYYGCPPGEVRKRYLSKSQVREHSKRSGDSEGTIRSIAVLPFDNFTGYPNQDFLVFGLHDALITELGSLRDIRVISKTSALVYTNTDKTIREICTELDVDAVIEASVLQLTEKLRIQMKLIRAFPEERQIWAQTFDVEMGNILNIFNRIIGKIAGEIQLSLSPDQRLKISDRRDVNPESYKAYLRGKYHLYQVTEEGMQKGLKYLHEAVRIDPAEPFAHAGLALGYMEIAHGPLNPGDAYIKAESAVFQALRLDPDLAEARLALAELSMYANWKWDDSEDNFRRALELNPYLSLAHYHYSWLLFLLGRNEEAVIEHGIAQKHDPFNPMIVAFTGILYAYLGRFGDAIKEANKALEIQQDCPDAYYCLEEVYLLMGKKEECISAARKMAESDPIWKWVLGFAYAAFHQRDEANRILQELLQAKTISWNAMGIACIHSALGNMDEVFKWLDYEPHHAWVPWTTVMPMGRYMHDDPRFAKFVRKWDMEDRWIRPPLRIVKK